MQYLEWEEHYNIGIKEIDIQHRGLFDIISKLSTTQRYEKEGKYFYAMLNQFVEFTKIHFLTEERYMREAGYPGLSEHQQEHAVFLNDVIQRVLEYEEKGLETQQEILHFLKERYMEHILGPDRDYQQTLIDHGFK
jgi:hemerythrin